MATITKRKWLTGKGESREAWQLAFTDAAGKRHKSQHATKREAESARIDAEGKVRSGTFRPDASGKNVEDAVVLYIASLKARHLRDAKVTKTYLNSVTAELQNYILARPQNDEKASLRKRATPFTKGIGTVKLSLLTSSRVGQLRDDLLEAGVSVVLTRRIIASFGRALGYAIEKDLLAINPARGVKTIGTRKEESKKVVPPTPAALKALLDKASPDIRIRILFAASSGLRASEQWALQWRHIDLEGKTVRIEQRLDVFGLVDTTKSKAGLRSVPLGRAIVEELKSYKRQTNKSGADDIVFPDGNGNHTRHGNFLKREFNPLVLDAKQSGFTWHGLRHYAVSQWIAAELPLKVIQTFAGHATLAITMDTYGHLLPSPDHSDIMDRIANGLLS